MSNHREFKKAQRFFQKQNYVQAEALCLNILEEDPQNIEALALLARVMLSSNRAGDALAMVQAGLSLAADHSGLYAVMGQIYSQSQKKEQAKDAFVRALQLDMENLEALLWLGSHHAARGEWPRAVECYGSAIMHDPDNQVVKQAFANVSSNFVLPVFTQGYKSAIVSCLEDDAVNPRHLSGTWIVYYKHDPVFAPLRDLEVYTEYDAFCAHVDLPALEACLCDPFFVYGLEKLRIYSVALERVLTHLRRYFLEQFVAGAGQEPLPFVRPIWALAMHCWINEYAFYVTPEEEGVVQQLQEMLERNDLAREAAAVGLYLLSCYRSPLGLEALDKVVKLIPRKGNLLLAKFVKKQIQNPREEAHIRSHIRQRTKISDDISQAVQAMYEENPYPRWDFLPLLNERSVRQDRISILSAGCGTGHQTAGFAREYPNADFTSVDLSLSSLAYATRQCRDLGMKHLVFEQADILELDQLPDRYDLIYCTGVLHHMQDPEAGLAVLKNILKPEGTMRLAFYSELGRAHIVKSIAYIQEKGYSDDAVGIRAFRHDVLEQNLRGEAPDFLEQLISVADFYRLSECRDLVFHVQEHRYTIPMLLEMLDRHGLEFIDFIPSHENMRLAFQERFPDAGDINDPMKWHEYEQENPSVFANMYVFNVRHKA